jgi:hypothetical protein
MHIMHCISQTNACIVFCKCAVPVTVNGVETSGFLDASEGLVSIDFFGII